MISHDHSRTWGLFVPITFILASKNFEINPTNMEMRKKELFDNDEGWYVCSHMIRLKEDEG